MSNKAGSGGTALGVALRVTPGFDIPVKYQNPGWLEAFGATPPAQNGFLQNFCTMNYATTALDYSTIVFPTPFTANVPVALNTNPAFNNTSTMFVYNAQDGRSYTTKKLGHYCALSISGRGIAAGSIITIHGFDIYKNKLTEQVTWSGVDDSVQLTKNAFALVWQVSCNNSGNAIGVGNSSTLGLYYRTPAPNFLDYIKYDDGPAGRNTIFTGINLITGSFDGTPTATTGDVRGLINLPVVVENGRNLVVSQQIDGMYPPMGNQTIADIFGQLPYSAF